MQRSKAERIKRGWGDDPCNHPKIAKESHGNVLTGYIICTQCGRPIYNSARNLEQERRLQPPAGNQE